MEGSVLQPLLFNIFINDIYLLLSNSYLSSYADEKTLDVFGFNLEEVKNVLRAEFNEVTRWFYENCMTLNARNVISYVFKSIRQMRLLFSKIQ